MSDYLCGNCCVPTKPFADTEGNPGQRCPKCGSLWYDWELKRAVRWMEQEEQQIAKRLANRRLAAAQGSALSFRKGPNSSDR